jgi:DNA topoisomerase I
MENAVQGLTHRQLVRIDKDYQTAASVANLTYVTDKEPGISRTRKGTGFYYRFRDKAVTDEKILSRIKKLAIPPAWTNVWICPSPDGHIQATGYDARRRKQYRYHTRWTALQHETKFHRMIEFGKVLPALREQMKKDLAQAGFPESKVMAMVIGLMERTFIRIGNDGYEKLYGSYGLSTLKNNHVDIQGDKITFSFKGKKGVYHRVLLKSKKFARIVKQCKAIPGKELFQYYDASGEKRKVDSGQVNQYLKNCLKMDFTTKDFRTWAGTLGMLEALRCAPPCNHKSDYQKNITAALEEVSRKLGNTVAICKKYYVHPDIVRMYREDKLSEFLTEDPEQDTATGLRSEEQVLMRILRTIEKTKVPLWE